MKIKDKIIKANPEIIVWACKHCGTEYAEYTNGCPKCATGEVGGSHSVFRKVRPILFAILFLVEIAKQTN